LDYTYDSSQLDDDIPYFIEIEGEETDMVELPLAVQNNDAALYAESPAAPGVSGRNRTAGRSAEEVFNIWKEEFDAAYDESLLFNLVIHPRYTGRAPRIRYYDKLIKYIKGHDSVWIARCIDVAEYWRKNHARAV
jgi:peptidoglycan/xylan/chitin deacetylase (PgdA/CDA1 family)